MSSKNTKLISIVTPVFNEEANLLELCQRIASTMKPLPYDYEHICIDNHSSDQTVALLEKTAKNDSHLKVIVNTRNFGWIRSSFHALMQAGGDAVILMASDLQDPPEMIPQFIKKWEEGFKTVLAVKPESEEFFLMFLLRKLFYTILTKISETPLVKNTTGSGLFDRVVMEVLREIKDPYPYFRGLVCEVGHSIATVPFKQPRRTRGVTSQNFLSLYDWVMLAVTKHSKLPLRLMTILGFLSSIVSMPIALYYLVGKLLFWNSFPMGTAAILVGVFFFGSLQMFFMGLLGEYILSIQTHVRDLPLVIERRRINFDS